MVLPQDAVHQDAMETRRPSPGAKQMGLLNRRLSQTGFLKIMIKYPAWERGHAVVRRSRLISTGGLWGKGETELASLGFVELV